MFEFAATETEDATRSEGSDNYRRPGSFRIVETCPSTSEVLGLLARLEAAV